MVESQHQEGNDDLIAILSASDSSGSRKALEVIRDNINRLRGPASGEGAQTDGGERLELRFSHGSRLGDAGGFVFGTEKTCDIVLPEIEGISKKHCALTFEKTDPRSREYRLVFRNLSDCEPAYVTYNNLGKITGKGANWTLNSQGSPNPFVRIELVILDDLRFVIAAEEREMDSSSYIARIEHFLQAT